MEEAFETAQHQSTAAALSIGDAGESLLIFCTTILFFCSISWYTNLLQTRILRVKSSLIPEV